MFSWLQLPVQTSQEDDPTLAFPSWGSEVSSAMRESLAEAGWAQAVSFQSKAATRSRVRSWLTQGGAQNWPKEV